jgi:hypothetical protein
MDDVTQRRAWKSCYALVDPRSYSEKELEAVMLEDSDAEDDLEEDPIEEKMSTSTTHVSTKATESVAVEDFSSDQKQGRRLTTNCKANQA